MNDILTSNNGNTSIETQVMASSCSSSASSSSSSASSSVLINGGDLKPDFKYDDNYDEKNKKFSLKLTQDEDDNDFECRMCDDNNNINENNNNLPIKNESEQINTEMAHEEIIDGFSFLTFEFEVDLKREYEKRKSIREAELASPALIVPKKSTNELNRQKSNNSTSFTVKISKKSKSQSLQTKTVKSTNSNSSFGYEDEFNEEFPDPTTIITSNNSNHISNLAINVTSNSNNNNKNDTKDEITNNTISKNENSNMSIITSSSISNNDDNFENQNNINKNNKINDVNSDDMAQIRTNINDDYTKTLNNNNCDIIIKSPNKKFKSSNSINDSPESNNISEQSNLPNLYNNNTSNNVNNLTAEVEAAQRAALASLTNNYNMASLLAAANVSNTNEPSQLNSSTKTASNSIKQPLNQTAVFEQQLINNKSNTNNNTLTQPYHSTPNTNSASPNNNNSKNSDQSSFIMNKILEFYHQNAVNSNNKQQQLLSSSSSNSGLKLNQQSNNSVPNSEKNHSLSPFSLFPPNNKDHHNTNKILEQSTIPINHPSFLNQKFDLNNFEFEQQLNNKLPNNNSKSSFNLSYSNDNNKSGKSVDKQDKLLPTHLVTSPLQLPPNQSPNLHFLHHQQLQKQQQHILQKSQLHPPQLQPSLNIHSSLYPSQGPHHLQLVGGHPLQSNHHTHNHNNNLAPPSKHLLFQNTSTSFDQLNLGLNNKKDNKFEKFAHFNNNPNHQLKQQQQQANTLNHQQKSVHIPSTSSSLSIQEQFNHNFNHPHHLPHPHQIPQNLISQKSVLHQSSKLNNTSNLNQNTFKNTNNNLINASISSNNPFNIIDNNYVHQHLINNSIKEPKINNNNNNDINQTSINFNHHSNNKNHNLSKTANNLNNNIIDNNMFNAPASQSSNKASSSTSHHHLHHHNQHPSLILGAPHHHPLFNPNNVPLPPSPFNLLTNSSPGLPGPTPSCTDPSNIFNPDFIRRELDSRFLQSAGISLPLPPSNLVPSHSLETKLAKSHHIENKNNEKLSRNNLEDVTRSSFPHIHGDQQQIFFNQFLKNFPSFSPHLPSHTPLPTSTSHSPVSASLFQSKAITPPNNRSLSLNGTKDRSMTPNNSFISNNKNKDSTIPPHFLPPPYNNNNNNIFPTVPQTNKSSNNSINNNNNFQKSSNGLRSGKWCTAHIAIAHMILNNQKQKLLKQKQQPAALCHSSSSKQTIKSNNHSDNQVQPFQPSFKSISSNNSLTASTFFPPIITANSHQHQSPSNNNLATSLGGFAGIKSQKGDNKANSSSTNFNMMVNNINHNISGSSSNINKQQYQKVINNQHESLLSKSNGSKVHHHNHHSQKRSRSRSRSPISNHQTTQSSSPRHHISKSDNKELLAKSMLATEAAITAAAQQHLLMDKYRQELLRISSGPVGLSQASPQIMGIPPIPGLTTPPPILPELNGTCSSVKNSLPLISGMATLNALQHQTLPVRPSSSNSNHSPKAKASNLPLFPTNMDESELIKILINSGGTAQVASAGLNSFNNAASTQNQLNLPPFLQQFFENMTSVEMKKEPNHLNRPPSNNRDESLNKLIIKKESSTKLDQNDTISKSDEKKSIQKSKNDEIAVENVSINEKNDQTEIENIKILKVNNYITKEHIKNDSECVRDFKKEENSTFNQNHSDTEEENEKLIVEEEVIDRGINEIKSNENSKNMEKSIENIDDTDIIDCKKIEGQKLDEKILLGTDENSSSSNYSTHEKNLTEKIDHLSNVSIEISSIEKDENQNINK